jgi:hypothetical protein
LYNSQSTVKNPLFLPAKASTVIRAFSYGGGVQSNAVMVLQAQGRVHYDVFIFANVGADSENPDTLAYIENYAKPYCEQHHIRFVEVQKLYKGHPDTLWRHLYRTQRSIDIPVRMSNGAPGHRNCTQTFKIEVINRWAKQQGVTHLITGLGISTDELERVRDTNWHPENGIQKRRDYSLIDLRVNRQMCKNLILNAGLPVPPKSSCIFCPFRRRNEWIEMKRCSLQVFCLVVATEQNLNQKRRALGKDTVFIHPDLVPLDQAVGDQMLLFDTENMASCDAGVCMV